MNEEEELEELRLWVALLVTQLGVRNGPGWRVEFGADAVLVMRAQLPSKPLVIITGPEAGGHNTYVVDVI